MADPPRTIRGRGSASELAGRFALTTSERDPEAADDDAGPAPGTELLVEQARTIITRNESPDVPFRQSMNPYRGCEHGCIYCYARPSHAYLELSPGLDFETRLFAKTNAVELLKDELAKHGYRVRIQPVDATDCRNLSAGVSKCSVFLGRSFSLRATALSCACE